MTVPFMYNFRSLPNKFPTISEINFFFFSPPQVRQFFVQKCKPKIFGFKNVMDRDTLKFSLP